MGTRGLYTVYTSDNTGYRNFRYTKSGTSYLKNSQHIPSFLDLFIHVCIIKNHQSKGVLNQSFTFNLKPKLSNYVLHCLIFTTILFYICTTFTSIFFLTGPDLVVLHVHLTKSTRIIFAQNSAQTGARGRLKFSVR